MPSVTCHDVFKRGERVYIRFDDHTHEFPNDQAVLDWVKDIESIENLRRLAVLIWLRRNPTGNNPSLIEGKTLTFNPDQVNNLLTVA
jgi:hypothetical protein